MTKYEAGDEILFADIEKGDRIRRTTTYGDGGTAIYEGIAVKHGTFYWDTSEGLTLAFNDDDNDPDILIELVDRPKPELPKVRGTIIKAKKVRGTTGDFVLILDDEKNWRSAILIEDSEYGGSYYWHGPSSIENWAEMELVTKK